MSLREQTWVEHANSTQREPDPGGICTKDLLAVTRQTVLTTDIIKYPFLKGKIALGVDFLLFYLKTRQLRLFRQHVHVMTNEEIKNKLLRLVTQYII